MNASFDFSGRVAVITGASHGIGRGVAQAFATSHADVVLVDLDSQAADELAQQIIHAGGSAMAVQCDVTRSYEVDQAFRAIVGSRQRIDVLVNCAGGFTKKMTMDATEDDEWDRVMDLNLRSTFLCTRASYPCFMDQRSGAIVNIGSVAGTSGSAGVSAPYAAAKAGVHQLTRTAAAELAKYGVRANVVLPGTTETERVNQLHGGDFMRTKATSVPLQRIGHVDDMVGAVLFLASDDASYITGKSLVIDGGALMV